MLKHRKTIELEGYVKSIKKSESNGIRTIFIEAKDGAQYSIGELGASLEDDVEARYIEIKAL